jgi:hypothetical protein
MLISCAIVFVFVWFCFLGVIADVRRSTKPGASRKSVAVTNSVSEVLADYLRVKVTYGLNSFVELAYLALERLDFDFAFSRDYPVVVFDLRRVDCELRVVQLVNGFRQTKVAGGVGGDSYSHSHSLCWLVLQFLHHYSANTG